MVSVQNGRAKKSKNTTWSQIYQFNNIFIIFIYLLFFYLSMP